MLTYVIRRLLWAVVLFIAVTMVTYMIFYVIPANPARLACGQRATESCITNAEHRLGLNRPVPVQYAMFMKRLVIDHSLGRSFTNRQDVNQSILDAAPVTASLVFGGAILWMLLALPIGILSALRPRSLLDRASTAFVLLGISLPVVWIGLVLQYTVGYPARVVPERRVLRLHQPDRDRDMRRAGAVGLPPRAAVGHVRAALLGDLRADDPGQRDGHARRGLRANGAGEGRPEQQVMRNHVLRNALLPIVTMLGMDIGIALGGAIFTETIFGLPGLGRLAVQALGNFDLPMIQGVVVFSTLCIIVFSIVVDIAYAWIDPRIRLQ